MTADRVVAALARPREAGTAGAAGARAVLADELTALGFEVEVQRFAFSPSSLNALPILGAGLGWLVLVTMPLLLLGAVPRWAALGAWLAGLAALLVLVRGVGLGWGARGTGLREDANLIATRPGAGPPRRWIVAHTDTKAQGHSMAGRLVAVWILVVAVLALSAAAIARLGGPLPTAPVAAAAGVALAAGILATRGRLRGESPGARDNGSGVIAVLEAARRITNPAVGVLLTGAEEFGLVGARILAESRPELIRGTDIVNLDTLDDRGTLSLVSHDARGRELAGRLAPLFASPGTAVRERRLPLGIFVDSYPLARGGGRAVTIGRLDWGTLRLLHTSRDSRETLRFGTALHVGRVLGSMPA
jgi:hypothetical protein